AAPGSARRTCSSPAPRSACPDRSGALTSSTTPPSSTMTISGAMTSTSRLGAAKLARDPRRVAGGHPPPARVGRGPHRDQPAEEDDDAADPDPRHERRLDQPERRRGSARAVARDQPADRLPQRDRLLLRRQLA